MADPDNSEQAIERQATEIVDGLVRTGREIDGLTAKLGQLSWEREQLMSQAWAQGVNVRLIARLAKVSRTLAQQAAERHAGQLDERRQDRALSARVERAARDRKLLGDDLPFYRRGIPLGKALFDLRTQRGMTQAEIARIAGIDRTGYSLFERGERAPSWTTIVRLANALDVSLDDLAKAVEPDDPPKEA
jgi:DNA-binding XRE family transcriptional regulator